MSAHHAGGRTEDIRFIGRMGFTSNAEMATIIWMVNYQMMETTT